MAKARPVTDTERARVRDLHAQGKGRNEIAEILERSGRTISKIAASFDPPLSFARAAEVRVATEVRQADLADRRAALAQRLQDVAERELERVNAPHKYFDWGGKDHNYDERWQDEPTPADKRALLGVVATAIDRSLKLSPPKDETGTEEGIALITNLMSGLTAVYKAQQGKEADEGA
ncbi:helix-turn-helix domain-containing protein [Streptomyces tagetis]|uniref:Helix-turn-helix domain-containing protein n=1 Tax=Streptomyces tagetis TaxID=2820809 RepID=A0A940XFY7_9ACTN|nr:helix-turn-helix domain-containing protein [Streptomyces sp. RG38]MBQ0827700.1 helix-turn-helix domain-containing protein [Streptomyces sp. RG38]